MPNRYERYLKDKPKEQRPGPTWQAGGPFCCGQGMTILSRSRRWECKICNTGISDEAAHALQGSFENDLRTSYERNLDSGRYIPTNEFQNAAFGEDDLWDAW